MDAKALNDAVAQYIFVWTNMSDHICITTG